MIEIFKKESLGKANYGWLEPRYHFSFANYYNPSKMGIGPLRVLNDDLIHPFKGFETHPHKNMEIITYIIEGELTHKDSMGNSQTISRGDIQYMSAGTGVTHSEYNNGNEMLRLLQIWILPNELNLVPSYGDMRFSKEDRHNRFLNIVSSKKLKGKVKINQDANIFVGEFDELEIRDFSIGDYDNIYYVQIEGSSKVNGNILKQGDALSANESIILEAITNSHVLLIQTKRLGEEKL